MAEKKQSFIKDKNGKNSSKRLIGFLSVGTAFIMAVILFYFSITSEVSDPITASELINSFLLAGSSLLGIGVIENFKISTKK